MTTVMMLKKNDLLIYAAALIVACALYASFLTYPQDITLRLRDMRQVILLQGATVSLLLCVLMLAGGLLYKAIGEAHFRPRQHWVYLAFALFGLTIYPFNFSQNATLSIYVLVNFFLVLLLFTLLLKIAFFRRLFSHAGELFNALGGRVADRWLVAGLMLLFVVLTCTISLNVFGGIPHIQDSISQYVYANILLHGSFTLPTHRLPQFFPFPYALVNGHYQNTVNLHGQLATQYPPGHSLLLALGMLAGVPWLVNPLLGALAILFVYLLAREAAGVAIARLSAVLIACSPFVIFMSSEYMNHATALMATTAAVYCCFAARRTNHVIFAFGAGLFMGLLFITRPINAVALGLPLLVWWWHNLRRWPRPRVRFAAAGLPVFLLFGGLQLYVNFRITGNPLMHAYRSANGELVLPGYMLYANQDWVSQFKTFFFQTSNNLLSLNYNILEIAIPTLIFATLALISQRYRKTSALLLVFVASQVVAYFTYYFQDWCFGARFFYETTGFIVILIAITLHILQQAVISRGVQPSLVTGTMLAFVLVCAAGASMMRLPLLVSQYRNNYWSVSNDYLATIERQLAVSTGKSLVFVQSDYRNVASKLTFRDDAPVIYAQDRGGAENRELMRYYPTRSVYIADMYGTLIPIAPLVW